MSTAYIMRQFALHLSGGKGKRPAAEVERTMFVRKGLLFTNTAVCGLLGLFYLFAKPTSPSIWPGLYIVPGGTYLSPQYFPFRPISRIDTVGIHSKGVTIGSRYPVMFGVILLAREAMVSVDLSYLENLRYEYKGA